MALPSEAGESRQAWLPGLRAGAAQSMGHLPQWVTVFLRCDSPPAHTAVRQPISTVMPERAQHENPSKFLDAAHSECSAHETIYHADDIAAYSIAAAHQAEYSKPTSVG